MQKSLFGGEILRLIQDHPTFAKQHDIRAICRIPGDLSQLLFFYVQLKDEKLPKAVIEKITRKFVGGAVADRYIIWFFGNKSADALKIVISGKEGKKIRLKTLSLEAGQWFKTYDYILSEVERKFNTGGLFHEFKEPSGLWKALWDAFDISIVNKKFYAEIKAVFDALTREELPKCKGLLTNEQDRVQFAIRLIGRIIFCWFLKRKGIITGDVMSSRAVEAEQNYYRDLLEPLFFDVFNAPLNERRKDLPASIRNYPFLNGGLFEPQLHDHKGNWALNISNNWFINFFNNTLERYNFTVDENSAASSEIAIDPEMLGRIFENLLAEQNPDTGESARKSTGSYYTPREIVDFMVEESLIAYLKTTPSPSSPPLKGGESNLIPSPLAGEGKGEGVLEDFVHTGTLPDALKPHSKELFEKLNAIKVLDPACGSGAFPISMLQKLAALKQQLDPKASPYALKLKTIENSIYGVDIQPMATELSRLRCWLSLIVDEDPKEIKPLPNLDFKFVTANSLIDLGYEEFIQKVETGKAPALFLQDFKNKLAELRTVRQKYFDPLMGQKGKDRLKKEFNTISVELLNMSHKLITLKLLDADFANKINSWEPFDDSRPAPFFNSEWMFGVEDGFDVVIANPPYVQFQKLDLKTRHFLRKHRYYESQSDLWYFFIYKAYELLNQMGQIIFIVSNYFLQAGHADTLRLFITDHAKVVSIINFTDQHVFDNVGVHSAILFLVKQISEDYKFPYTICEELCNLSSKDNNAYIISKAGLGKTWSLVSDNDANLLDKLLNKGQSLGSFSKISNGIKSGDDNIFVINHPDAMCQIEKKLLRDYIKNSEMHRYYIDKPKKKIIYTTSSTTIDTYPLFKKYILQHKKGLESKWVNRGENNQYWKLYRAREDIYNSNKELIITPYRTNNFDFALNDGRLSGTDTYLILNTCSQLISEKVLLGILNSRLILWIYKKIGKRKGKIFEIATRELSLLPIVFPADTKGQFINLVDCILSITNDDNYLEDSAKQTQVNEYAKQIDDLVYALYNLTPEEIAIVEGRN